MQSTMQPKTKENKYLRHYLHYFIEANGYEATSTMDNGATRYQSKSMTMRKYMYMLVHT